MADATQTCSVCGSAYRRASAQPDVCWHCARQRQSTAKPIGVALPAIEPRDGERFTCTACGGTYPVVLRAAGGCCVDCERRRARGDDDSARQRLARRQRAGIEKRHRKYLDWGDLQGPPAFLRALEIVRRFAESGDGLLALVGRRGMGKTQLAVVGVWQAIEHGKPARVADIGDLVGSLKGRFQEGGDCEGDWLREWTAPDLLVVDEVAELVAGDFVRSSFTRLCDKRYSRCLRTILIANLDAEQFAGAVGPSIVDRVNETGGLTLCDWPSFRTGPIAVHQPAPDGGQPNAGMKNEQ